LDARQQLLANQTKMTAWLMEEKPTSVDRKPEAAQRDVLREDAAMMPGREPTKKRRKDRKLAAERTRQMKEWPQNQNGCLKRVAVARRRTSRRAEVARPTKETERRCPVAQQWHDAGDTFSERARPRKSVATEGVARRKDTVSRVTTGTMLHQDTRKSKRSGSGVEHIRKVTKG
jgi:hypothetical protein